MEQKQLDNSPIVYYTHDCGASEWVLFLHPAFVDHRVFQKQYDFFEGKLNLLAIDLLGHGASKTRSRDEHILLTPKWINAILDHEKIVKIHLVGISLGGVMAQLFAQQYPEKTGSLACFGVQKIYFSNAHNHPKIRLSDLFLGIKGLISVKWFAKASRSAAAVSPEGQDAYYKIASEQSKAPFLLFVKAVKSQSTLAEAEHKYPVLIGRGEHDQIVLNDVIKA